VPTEDGFFDIETRLKEFKEKLKEESIKKMENRIEKLEKEINKQNQESLKDQKSLAEEGCMQFVYCNECLAYPMGLGCPKKENEND